MGYRNEKCSRIAIFLRRTALDELPQIINIVKGEMSFVGPRPLVPQELYACAELKMRSRVLPGLTGLAQLLAAKDSPVSEKFKYDISYIESQSIFLDIMLILRSFGISLGGKWDRMNRSQV
jgi:lipopolysaccharide/colanic/teichoic acid biosynthesis glycosyltransferase